MKRTGRINPVSASRQRKAQIRQAVVAIVHERAGHRCWYIPIIPEIACHRFDWTRSEFEVDELRGGSYRVTEMYDPDSCRLTCQAHHRWKTENKPELLERLARYEETNPWPSKPALPSDPS